MDLSVIISLNLNNHKSRKIDQLEEEKNGAIKEWGNIKNKTMWVASQSRKAMM